MKGDPVNDTHPAAEAVLLEEIRKMSPERKIGMVRGITRRVISLSRAGVRRRHPEASEREEAMYLASRWLPPDLMFRAFGWDVKAKGY